MTETSTPAVITLGETMAMVTPATATPLATATEFRMHAGGAESNVAAHLAALGTPASWVSALGADALGDRVLAELEAHGVDTRWVSRDADAPTGLYVKDPGNGVLYYRRGSAASRLTSTAIRSIPFERARLVHLSGITPALSADCSALIDTLLDRLHGSEVTVSFDVNHRAALWRAGEAPTRLRALARRADVVYVGLDEAHALWQTTSPAAVRALLPEPGLVIVKDGDVGATEIDRDGIETFVPAIRTEVTEAVGAGDAFAAGHLHAMLAGADATARLTAGHERAHLVLQSTSDFSV